MSDILNGPASVNFLSTTPLSRPGSFRVYDDPYFHDGSEELVPTFDNLDAGSFGIEDVAGNFAGDTLLAALQEMYDALVLKTSVTMLPSISPSTLFDATGDVAETQYNHSALLPSDAAVGFFKCTLTTGNGASPALVKWSDPAAPSPLKDAFVGWTSIDKQRILHLALPLEPGRLSTWSATVPTGSTAKLELIGYGKAP